METKSSLISELKTLQVKLGTIVDTVKSENRDLTDSELKTVEDGTARITDIKASLNAIERGEKGASLMKQAAHIDNPATEWKSPATGETYSGVKSANGADGFITPDSVKRLAAAQVARLGTKGLVADGSNATQIEFDPKPQPMATPGANLGILDVIAVKARDSEKYSYVRQSVRTNNADVVAAGAQKPTSVFTVEQVEGKLNVVAHMSEYVGTYLLEDNPALESFLGSELRAGVLAKVAELAVDEFAGTTGAQTQAFSTNAMDSIYLGASKASALGYNPDVVLLPRATYDQIMLAKNADGEYLYRKEGDSRINGLTPVIVDSDADKAIVLDSSKVGISTDKTGIKLKWDAFSKFDYNQVRALVEGRFAIDVFAAPAIVVVTTAGE